MVFVAGHGQQAQSPGLRRNPRRGANHRKTVGRGWRRGLRGLDSRAQGRNEKDNAAALAILRSLLADYETPMRARSAGSIAPRMDQRTLL
jgi:hypothetical protein